MIGFAHTVEVRALARLGELLKGLDKATGGTHGGRKWQLLIEETLQVAEDGVGEGDGAAEGWVGEELLQAATGTARATIGM